MFEKEAEKTKQILGSHCVEIHHIGSTSVPGLSAKEDLDILCIVDKLSSSLVLQDSGYTFKGELNIPLRYYFSKNTEESKVNLHVVEPGHDFSALNLCFRDYLRSHEEVRKAYEDLKHKLVKDPSSFERVNGKFPRYTLEKNDFIKSVLEQAGYNGLAVNFCTHYREWKVAKLFRQKYFFDQVPITDPYTWTFDHPDHTHFVLYKGVDITGYAHIQLWPEQRAAIRIIVIDKLKRDQGFGQQFLSLIEHWLKEKNYKSVHTEASQEALQFYKKHGYTEMPFNDPDAYETDPQDTPLGKVL